ncbi:ABC transporter substrate-binding protein [Methylibium sp.]|uniref:ABC transporter substrate-binding protein n=1 Tax=Methylibium sp. TaxID=2067992 RepID=UPI0025DBAE99|nr:helical backbone metal receptor [Methylibium sp.]
MAELTAIDGRSCLRRGAVAGLITLALLAPASAATVDPGSAEAAPRAPENGAIALLAMRSGVTAQAKPQGFRAAQTSPRSAPTERITVRDDRGVSLSFAAPPARIVSLLPSLTESVCALGGCARLVGIDRFSDWPSEVQSLPRLGGLEDAQIERIVALEPDVVLAAASARSTQRLEALGLKVLVVESQTHADVKRTLGLLARLLGTPDEAARLWSAIEQDLQRAAALVPPARRGQRVYFEVASAPYAAGAASFIGETLARLGMANAVPAELGPFPKLNPEYVVRIQPDIVMAVQREIDAMPRRPGWRHLRALQQQRTCGFAAGRYEMLVRPGPRLGEAALQLADCLAMLEPR